MATIKAFIRTSKADKNKSVNVRFRLSDGRDTQIFHKSEILIIPDKWDEKQQKIKARCIIDETDRNKIDNAVEDRKKLIKKIYSEKGKTLTSDLLDTEVDKVQHPEKYKILPQTFFEVFDEFLRKQKNELSKTRYNLYKVVFRCLKRFEVYSQKTDQTFKLELDTITPDTIQSFSGYLKNEYKYFEEHPDLFNQELYSELSDNKERKQSELKPRGQNTVNDILKKLRTFLLWCKKKAKKTTNDPFDDFKIEGCKYGTPYYITIDERNQLYNLNLSHRPELEIQRDIFVFQCLIGCRVGDLYTFTKANIIDGEIHYIAQKSKEAKPETLKIPLNKIANEILNKYTDFEGKKLFPFISEQKYNKAIKKSFELAKITRNVMILDPLTRENVIVPINEVASSHLARRCFVGNLYKKVKDQNLVAELSGHQQNSRAFARYREVDKEMKKELVKMLE